MKTYILVLEIYDDEGGWTHEIPLAAFENGTLRIFANQIKPLIESLEDFWIQLEVKGK